MNTNDWDIGRKGREWSGAEFDQRVSMAPDKLEDWKAAIAEREKRQRSIVE